MTKNSAATDKGKEAVGETSTPAAMNHTDEDNRFDGILLSTSRSANESPDVLSYCAEDGEASEQGNKKKYHRHTPYQINELESFFKEYPHPDEKQRAELGKRLNMDGRQVKFWFQNKRTQLKSQVERHENHLFRQENDKLRMENIAMKEAMRNPICKYCGGPAVLGEARFEDNAPKIENARLREELSRIYNLAEKFLGRECLSMATAFSSVHPESSLERTVGRMGLSSPGTMDGAASLVTPSLGGVPGALNPNAPAVPTIGATSMSPGGAMYVARALEALHELVQMAQTRDPLWFNTPDGELLNYEEYLRLFAANDDIKPAAFITEATRATGVVMINSFALVEAFMDVSRWADIFQCMVARATSVDMMFNGMGGNIGSLKLVNAEFQVLSPLVPNRHVQFLRCSKKQADGVWVVVDVSTDDLGDVSNGKLPLPNCRKLPSGFIAEDLANGLSKVTWVEHVAYDDRAVHNLYQPLVSSGMGFGAQRWVTTLQRQCECFTVLMSSKNTELTTDGWKSMIRMGNRMVYSFCTVVSASTVHKWEKANVGNAGEDVRVLLRRSIDVPGEPSGVILSAATSIWMPIPRRKLFDFLRNKELRNQWDLLSNGKLVEQMVHIPKGHDPGNSISLLHTNSANSAENNLLIFQESWTDGSGSVVVYAPVDHRNMNLVMSGAESASVALLPSGFAIHPDGLSDSELGKNSRRGKEMMYGGDGERGACLLTAAFQILVSNVPSQKLNVASVNAMTTLISFTIHKIKEAFGF
ncbi:Homeobox domain [Dillenia turbinata]|uniref:Homeobox domain n=1 Tax=Dillenia turbinata TaxID=194707 RepID=A0AAN8ZFU8_9MAGN